MLGELDDQDRILACQADQDHEADLGEDVDVLSPAIVHADATALSKHIGTTR